MQESVAAKEGANENGPRSPQRIAKLGGVRKYQEGDVLTDNIYSGQGGYNWQHQARTNPYIDFTGLKVGDPGSAAAAA